MRRKDRLVTDTNEIKDIIRRGQTCWVAIVDNAIPRMTSLNYSVNFLDGDILELYFQYNPNDEKLDIFKQSNEVCFEISYDEGMYVDTDFPRKSTLYYSSVIGNGRVVSTKEPIKSTATIPISAVSQLCVDVAKIIVSQNKTCHIAMSDNGLPYIVPLSYGSNFTNDNTLELYFHSATEGKKIDVFKKNNNVCFEINNASGTFVRGNGKVVFLEGDEKHEALAIMFRHQTGKDIVVDDAMTKGICVYKIVSTDFIAKTEQWPQANLEQNENNRDCKIISTNYTAKKNSAVKSA